MCISSNSNLIFPCKICNTNTKDTDSAAECDIYQFWIHMICNNLNHNSTSLVLKPCTNLSLLFNQLNINSNYCDIDQFQTLKFPEKNKSPSLCMLIK